MLLVSERGTKKLILKCRCGRVSCWGKWIKPTPEMEREMKDNDPFIHYGLVKCKVCESEGA